MLEDLWKNYDNFDDYEIIHFIMRKHARIISLVTLLFLLGHFLSCYNNTSADSSKDVTVRKGDYVNGELPVQHGMELFNQHCASCHSFSENGIGPNLAGVTTAVDKEWLVVFINNLLLLLKAVMNELCNCLQNTSSICLRFRRSKEKIWRIF
ncbi:MAG: cytochrome c [Saprospiraceae bacterium]|nr:cytochrome c [Saprospiraceae bacterium]